MLFRNFMLSYEDVEEILPLFRKNDSTTLKNKTVVAVTLSCCPSFPKGYLTAVVISLGFQYGKIFRFTLQIVNRGKPLTWQYFAVKL